MKKLLLTLFIALIGFSTWGQTTTKKDSLLRLLPAAHEDTAKVHLLLQLASTLKNKDIVAAYQYCAEAQTLSQKLGYDKGRFDALLNEIALIRLEHKDSLSLVKCKTLLQMAEQLKDSLKIASAYLNLGEVYDRNGDNTKAVEYCLKGLAIAERANKIDLLQDAYASMQRIYFSRSEFDKAILYGKKAIEIARVMKDKHGIMTQSYNLAYTYNITKEFDKSIATSNEVIQIAHETGDQRLETYALYNLCSIHLRTGKYQEALAYGNHCLQVAQKTTDRNIESTVLAALGSIDLQLKKNKEAEAYLLRALDIKSKADDKLGIAEVKGMLSNVYFSMGNPSKAYALEREVEDYNDAYNQSVLTEQSSEMEKKYETQKKEEQIKSQQASLKQKSILNYLLIAIAAALVIILTLSYRNYSGRQKLQQAKIDELQTEKQLDATAAVLKGEEQERTRLAKDLHDGLGGMLSGIKFSLNRVKGNMVMTPDNAQAFERSIDMLDSSIKEMRRVAHNMMPEILVKYGLDTALKEFCSEINRSGAMQLNYQSLGVTDVVEQTTAVTIYRIVQELINNALKHSNAQNVLVQLHFSAADKLLAVTVEDDGNGFDTNILGQSGGMGWKSIQNRVEFLKGRVDIQSSPDKGTSVMIEINT